MIGSASLGLNSRSSSYIPANGLCQPVNPYQLWRVVISDEDTPSFSTREKQSQRNIRNNSTFQCTLQTSLCISKILSKAMSKTPRVDQLSNRTIAHFNVVQAVAFMTNLPNTKQSKIIRTRTISKHFCTMSVTTAIKQKTHLVVLNTEINNSIYKLETTARS